MAAFEIEVCVINVYCFMIRLLFRQEVFIEKVYFLDEGLYFNKKGLNSKDVFLENKWLYLKEKSA